MRNPQFVFDQFRASFAPRKPRNPLLRVLVGIVGIALLAALLVAGLVVGTLMLLANLAMRLLRGQRTAAGSSSRPAQSRNAAGVIDADYTVVNRPSLDTPR